MSKVACIKCGSAYLQGFTPNENYAKTVRAIQTGAHLGSEYDPIFDDEPKWMDCITAKGYLQTLMDIMRWDDAEYWRIDVIVESENFDENTLFRQEIK
jgi:hypothetical protein